MQIKTSVAKHFTPNRKAILKNKGGGIKITWIVKYWQGCGKISISNSAGGNVKCLRCCGKWFSCVPQYAEHRTPIPLTKSTPRLFLQKDWKGLGYLHTNVHCIAHSHRKAETIRMPTSVWINQIWYIHTMGEYSATKGNKIRVHATTWMNPENITVSGRRQTQRDRYYRIPIIRNI